jgi:hypothetical protein
LRQVVRNRPWNHIFGSWGRLGIFLLNLKVTLKSLLGTRAL